MVATPTSRARFIKQGYQDNPESWGGELNTGALDRIDDARGQWVTKALTGDYTLDVQNYIQDEARAPMLRFTGTGTFTVTAPAVSYWYIVKNDCTGSVNMKPSGGSAAEIRAGTTVIWETDGTNAWALDPTLDKIKAPAAAVAMNNQKLTGMAKGAVGTNDGATLANTVSEFAPSAAALDMNGQKIVDGAPGTATTDFATLGNKVHEFAAPTAALAMNNQKITGLGSGSASTDAANIGDIQTAISAAATINLPTVTGNAGRYLTTNGTVASWSEVDWAASVDVASAATTNIGTAASNRVRITGTTTITSFGTSANKTRMVLFAAALTLTHNATSLILPTGANITTAAGDVALCVSDGSGNWRVISYMRADGKPVGTINTALLDNDAVTYAKIQNISSASRLLGRGSAGGAGDPEEITLGTGLSMSGTALSVSLTAGFTLATPVATTSGTAFDFTGIPSTARLIFVMFSGVSLSATDNFLVQIGPSGGITSSGYTSSAWGSTTTSISSTSGFIIGANNAGRTFNGIMQIALLNSSTNLWVSSHSFGSSSAAAYENFGGGTVALSGTLTQLRITRTGTDTFDAGSVNISYI